MPLQLSVNRRVYICLKSTFNLFAFFTKKKYVTHFSWHSLFPPKGVYFSLSNINTKFISTFRFKKNIYNNAKLYVWHKVELSMTKTRDQELTILYINSGFHLERPSDLEKMSWIRPCQHLATSMVWIKSLYINSNRWLIQLVWQRQIWQCQSLV